MLLKATLAFFLLCVLTHLGVEYKACQGFCRMFSQAIYTSLGFDNLNPVSLLKDCSRDNMNDRVIHSFYIEFLYMVIYRHFNKEMFLNMFCKEICKEMMLEEFLKQLESRMCRSNGYSVHL